MCISLVGLSSLERKEYLWNRTDDQTWFTDVETSDSELEDDEPERRSRVQTRVSRGGNQQAPTCISREDDSQVWTGCKLYITSASDNELISCNTTLENCPLLMVRAACSCLASYLLLEKHGS